MRTRKNKIAAVCFGCAILIAFSALCANADIYRYIDDNGVMHFTNTPTSSKHHFKVYLKERPKRQKRSHSTKKFDNLITDASQQYGISFPLLKAMIKAESDFDPQAVSRKGAKGLMQIMPENYKVLGIQNPFDPKQNINGGARYFRQLYDKYGKVSLSLAAYNAGPTAVDQYKTIPPYQETEQYVERVLKFYYQYKNL